MAISDKRLKKIVRHYKENYKEQLCRGLQFFKKMKLKESIKKAALAVTADGGKHEHQCRISPTKLEEYKDKLLEKKDEIKEQKNFDELHELTKECKLKGIGELTIYDTALRIGANVRKLPEKVYLHRGTLIGARNLFKSQRIRGRVLSSEELPCPLRELAPHHIENLLCIYKDCFLKNGCPLPKKGCSGKKRANSCGS